MTTTTNAPRHQETISSTLQRPEPICGGDAWMPVFARVAEVRRENFNTKTYRLQFQDGGLGDSYQWLPGQFNMLYLPGIGEAAISLSSDPGRSDYLDHTIRTVGSVTRGIESLGEGGIVGLRGPFGRGWPVDRMEGRDVVLMAGGIGLAPLRPVVYWVLRRRERYGRVILLYGCRTPEDRIYAEELEAWEREGAIDVLVTVDNTTGDWTGPVGVVTDLLRRIRVAAERTVVMVCGPPILNRVGAWSILQLHVPPENVFVSLERNMNCGFGRCGHCQYGGRLVCLDGPVFAFAEIADIFAKEEI